ncbi:DUF4097 family beta strand repeat-containing protein [Silvibacterium dinghuense]|uniref:DUF4097 domain-containing protein n=1 Tax=Silvibacterium dinghuense TaxID=1560006 RepID=A0A4V1NW34_9BACT|nr:DUF4097 family beta strand repeat-containing protein [Silvibacterium dinghuense]RXS98032.1 hypothetical protein ESZ00_09370 [Silvibacterium dinghuense]GGH03976.1 hypothetical protein GCM10011586_19980 [Silvibacterium dinghuense]
MPLPKNPLSGYPMRRFALFVAVFAVIVAAGTEPSHSSHQSWKERWQQFAGSFRPHAHAEAAMAEGAALGTVDGWAVRACTADDHQQTHWGWGGERQRVCEMRTLRLATPSKLDISSMNGGIHIIGEDRQDVAVEARVEAWSDDAQDAAGILHAVQLEANDGRIRDQGPSMHGGNRGYAVSYTIHAPHQISAELKTMNGGIGLEHLNGELRFDTTNGGVDLSDLAGDVKGSTVNGGLDIALSGTQWHGQGLDAETTNGGISLNLPERYAAHLETGTVNGGIEVNFPVTVQGEIRHHLATDLNGGGPTIHAETTNGGVTISHAEGESM